MQLKTKDARDFRPGELILTPGGEVHRVQIVTLADRFVGISTDGPLILCQVGETRQQVTDNIEALDPLTRQGDGIIDAEELPAFLTIL